MSDFLKINNGIILKELASAPSSPIEGMIYYDTTLNKLQLYNGSAWVDASVPQNLSTTATPQFQDVQVIGSGLGNRMLGKTLALASSTGLVSGGILSINGGNPAHFDLSAGTGEVVDVTNPAAPIVTPVSWSTLTNITVTNLATADVTYILINSSGTIVQQTTYPTPIERRDNIFIGRLNHVSRTSISFADTFPDYKLSPIAGFYDLVDAMAPFKIGGIQITPNGANLSINKSAGSAFFRSAGYSVNIKNPNISNFTGATPQAFRKMTQTSIPDVSDVTVIDPANYDVGGVVTPIPGGGNTSTIQRVYLYKSGSVRIQYGQNTYTSLVNALAALSSDTFVPNTTIENTAILIGYIVVRKGATNLSLATDARFIVANRFDSGGSAVASGTTTLQQAYLNSTLPQIILESAQGTFTIDDNATPLGTDLFQVRNNAGTTDYLAVAATGTSVSNLIGTGTTGAIRLHNLTTTQRNALTPATGMEVWNTTTGQMEVYNGTSWTAVGSSGANQTLSNLTNPTAINENLIFNKSGPIVKSGDQIASTPSQNMRIQSGDTDSGNSGQTQIATGSSVNGQTGAVNITSGNSTNNTSGGINLTTGASGILRGSVAINAGSMTVNTLNNQIALLGTGVQGMRTNDNLGAGNTIAMNINSGDAFSGNSGDVNIASGTASGIRGKVVLNGSSISASGNQIKSTGEPTVYNDTATKNYVDSNTRTNFITNSNAELTNTTGYVTYADAAGSAPVDGTGGSPNVTFTNTSSSPLTGLRSFLFTKDAANRQGQGASYDFTIDAASKAKVLSINFDYIVSSGTFVAGNPNDRTSAGDSDITVWVYDVTNGVMIQPSTYRLYSNSTTVADKFISSFQTSSNSTSYRLIMHCATTSAAAFTLTMDNFKIEQTNYAYSSPITDWVDGGAVTIFGTTSNPTKGTVAVDKLYYRRVGDSLELRYQYRQTATGSAGSGLYYLLLPNNLQVDLNKINNLSTSGADTTLGAASVQASSTFLIGTSQLFGGTTNRINLLISNDTIAPSGWGSSIASLGNATVEASFTAKVPIQGWSSSVQMSDSADTRVVDFVGFVTTQALTANVTNIVSTAIKDSHAAWSGSTYVVPVAGDYSVGTTLYSNSAPSTFSAFVNGTVNKYISGSTAAQPGGGFQIIPNLKAGDILSFRATANITLASDSSQSISISRISGPVAISATETIAASYYCSTNQSASTSTPINFDTKEYDTHGAVTTGSGWRFTAPASGLYQFETYLDNTTATGGAFVVYKNGSSYKRYSLMLATNFNSGSSSIRLNAGDYIEIRPTASVTLGGTSLTSASHISIFRFGL